MKAIITRARPDGTFPDVGTNDRIVASHYTTIRGVERRAQAYAAGASYRIELFHADRFYGEPFRVIVGR